MDSPPTSSTPPPPAYARPSALMVARVVFGAIAFVLALALVLFAIVLHQSDCAVFNTTFDASAPINAATLAQRFMLFFVYLGLRGLALAMAIIGGLFALVALALLPGWWRVLVLIPLLLTLPLLAPDVLPNDWRCEDSRTTPAPTSAPSPVAPS